MLSLPSLLLRGLLHHHQQIVVLEGKFGEWTYLYSVVWFVICDWPREHLCDYAIHHLCKLTARSPVTIIQIVHDSVDQI